MCNRLILFVSRCLLLACIAVGGWVYAADVRPGDTPVLPTLTTLDGKTINPASLRGKAAIASARLAYARL